MHRTTACALIAGLPGLVLTALAAGSSTSLALRTDLLLTLLDMAALSGAWAFARHHHRDPVAAARAEHLVTALVAGCMVLSMLSVMGCAVHRAWWGEPAVGGPGLVIGFGLNVVSGFVNLRLMMLWRERVRHDPGSPFLRSQLRLFADKLCSNILLAGSLLLMLILEGQSETRLIDPAVSLVMALASAYWAWPVACQAVRQGVKGKLRLKACESSGMA
ncbi:cation transporter [Rubellimicrobium arenae]|uniref:cation transporter n=1 Tax=Rubellimicrobium arenae TaxID=2817372 RepID=UPI001B3122FA|nr:cation transporter [Rubellimicrobium arenae]